MSRRVLLALLSFSLLLTAAQDDKTYRADRFDVAVVAEPDRSLSVEETVTFRFAGGPFSFVFRELPTDHTDGITDIVAGVDGVPWPQGEGPGQVEISGGNPIEIVWHLPPTSDAVHTFDLSYRAQGVVRQEEGADVLDWQALPDEHDYTIDGSRVTIQFPPDADLLSQPEMLTVGGEGSAVSAFNNTAVFEALNLAPGDPLVARLSFAPGAFAAAPPAWQTQQTAQTGRAWVWFAAAGAVLLTGVLLVFRAMRPYTRSIPTADSYLYKPPLDLPPALAGYLANTTIGWQHGLATLFDLAGRGLIEIEQTGEKSLLRAAEFTVRLLDRPQGLRPHEQALVDTLFTDRSGVEYDEVTLSEMGRLITSSRWKNFTETLEEEAGQEGLTDPAVKQRRRKLVGWGVALLLVALALMLAAFLLKDLFGLWPMIAVGAVALVAIFAMIGGAALSPLSDKGMQYAIALEPFRRLVKDVARGKMELPDLSYFTAYLPHATAYGLAEAWVKRQEKSDYREIPSYIRAAGESGANMGAFVAVIAATSHSGGAAAAGAAGAAAAGGGASGAG